MAELNYQTNPDELEQSFEVVPAGEYIAIIENSDYTMNKSSTGKILKLTYQIIDGPMKGRKIFENLNLENQNQQAVEISRKALNSIGVACGVAHIKDSSQLHNHPMKLDVGVKEDDTFGKQNRIKKHIKIDASVQNNQQDNVQKNESPPASPTTAKAKSPWEK